MNTSVPTDPVSRRAFLRLAAGGTAALGGSSWLRAVADHAKATGRKYKSCILLFMRGGPTHIDTFDPKPQAPQEYRGKFEAIPSAAIGVQISELFPQMARQMRHAAIIRGMSTTANEHSSARYLMHTGYSQTEPKPDGKPFPAMGSVAAKELGDLESLAPNYVYLGAGTGGTLEVYGPGFLAADYRPLVVAEPDKGVENLKPTLDKDRFTRRVGLLDYVQDRFRQTYQAEAVQAHRTNFRRAVGLMQSDVAKAFDISREAAPSAAAYGNSPFGKQCLMARRLIEVGIPFIEVARGHWDHHQNLSKSLMRLCPEIDTGMSALVATAVTITLRRGAPC